MIPMLGLITALTLAPQAADTTFAVRKGARLSVEARTGSVTIDTWERSSVRVDIGDASPGDVEIHNGASTVSVETEPRSSSRNIRYRITVPTWMDVRVDAHASPVRVSGTAGEVAVSTVRGSIEVRGGRNFVSAESVEGMVTVEDVRGRVHVETVNQGVRLDGIQGEISAEAVNGGVSLSDIDSKSVEVETVNGRVTYEGTIQPSGYYHLSSHNGSVRLLVPELPDAKMRVSTFNGTFQSDFPLQLTSMKEGKELNFVIGSGSARVELESFNGTIILARRGGGGR